ncbi:MAG: mevalonate kinase [Anaerolineaceae bacterium]|nr:mevalonate kinase [Anaerolineaceae bacterium]
MSVTASASAKTILFGEHAVVYNEPAIAIPLSNTRTYAELIPNSNGFRIISPSIHLNKTFDELISGSGLQVLLIKIKELFDLVNLPDLTLLIHSDIPIASGLGSGAALSAAIIRVFAMYYSQTLSWEKINETAYEVEKIYHGTPSGIDNTTIAYEQPIIFSKSTGFCPLEADLRQFSLLIVDSGIRSRTIEVVTAVRENISHNEPYIREIGKLVQNSVPFLQEGNREEIGRLMNENQKLLQMIDVSSPELDDLIRMGLSHGAIGGKLTGAGRGGNILILARDEEQSKQLRNLYENSGFRVIQ